MYPGRGKYTYNNAQQNYQRPPVGPPSGFGGNYPQNNGYSSNQSTYNDDNRYDNNNYNDNNGYSRPPIPAPPPQYDDEYNQNYGSYPHPQQNYNSGFNERRDRPPVPLPGETFQPSYTNAPSEYQHPQQLQAPPFMEQQFNSNMSQTFNYSQCSGKRKALIIGINYIGSKNQLRGCINDANNIFTFLTQNYGYARDDIVMLTDDQHEMVRVPTRENMIRAMQWLVKGAQPNDSLFFHYSGHGGLTKDLDGDEESGMDSVIYPVDFEVNGPIIDDDMHAIMVKSLPQGCRLTALFDSCHSGSALDLPYTYSTKGIIKEQNVWKDVGQEGLQAVMGYAMGNRQALISSLTDMAGLMKNSMGNNGSNGNREKIRQVKFSPADVIMFSGSKDNQTSADAVEDGKNIGAMSWSFIKVLTLQPQQSYLSLLQNMRQELSKKYSQKPQLSASHPIDVNLQFIF